MLPEAEINADWLNARHDEPELFAILRDKWLRQRGTFFRESDFNLPLLTWAAQVNEDDNDEMNLMYWRGLARAMVLFGDGMIHYGRSEADLALEMSVTNDSPPPAMIDALSDACFLAKGMLADLCDKKTFTIKNMSSLNELLRQRPVLDCQDGDWASYGFTSDYWQIDFPIQRLIEFDGSNLLPNDAVAEDLKSLMLGAKGGKFEVRRCEECRNVFVVQRTIQRFCSGRCRTRFGIRNMRMGKTLSG